MRGAPL